MMTKTQKQAFSIFSSLMNLYYEFVLLKSNDLPDSNREQMAQAISFGCALTREILDGCFACEPETEEKLTFRFKMHLVRFKEMLDSLQYPSAWATVDSYEKTTWPSLREEVAIALNS